MTKRWILLAGILALGACDDTAPKKPAATPSPTPTPSALYSRPSCGATASAVDKLVCGHKGLDWLDRSLQKQWAAARKDAPAAKLAELDALQAKFLAERNACKDATCIAAAYHHYLAKS